MFCYVRGCDGDPLSIPVGKAAIALPAGGSKGSGGEDVRLTEPPLLGKPSPDIEGALVRITDVLDIALTLRHRGAVSRDSICGLLTECLQDVSCVFSMILLLLVLMLGF
jgi:hypothetical protein